MLQESPQVADGDLVFRRFDPTNSSHWTVDEGRQNGGRLRAGAFRWDPEPSSSPSRFGCSVYQQSRLQQLNLSQNACLDDPGWQLASVDPGEVRALTRSTLPNSSSPFDVVQSPYPQGEEGAPLRDAAHADISHENPSRGISKWYSELAKRFSLVEC